ncbi:MAG: SpoIIE family protein phosphatase [Capsulimonadaceae bacterium]
MSRRPKVDHKTHISMAIPSSRIELGPGCTDPTAPGPAEPSTEPAWTDQAVLEALAGGLLSHVRCGIAHLDPDLRFVRANDIMAEIYRTPPSALPGRSAETVYGGLWPSRRSHLQRTLAGATVLDIPIDTMEPGSNRFWTESYYPLRVDSDVVGILVVGRESTGPFTHLQGLSPAYESLFDALMVADLEGRIRDCNASFLRRTGYAREDVVGRRISMLTAPGQADSLLTKVIDLLRTDGRWAGDIRYVRRDGMESIAETNIAALRDPRGALIGFVAAMRDITERKRSEAALRDSEERYRNAAEQLASAYARERLINEIGQAIRHSGDPRSIQQAALRALGEALKVDRCYLVTCDVDRDLLSIVSEHLGDCAVSGVGDYPGAEFRRLKTNVFHGATTAVVRDSGPCEGALRGVRPRTGRDPEARGGGDAVHPETAPIGARSGPLRERSFIGVPLFLGGVLAESLFVGMDDVVREWSSDEVMLAETVATMIQAAVERARIEQRERTIASRLQENLHPKLPRSAPGLRLADYYRPALEEAEVGGDFADCFAVDTTSTCLVVCDLSGKGLAAAVQVGTVRDMLRFAVYGAPNLVDAITRLNRTIAQFGLIAGFATLFVGRYDALTRRLVYVNCGQEPGLVYRAALKETLLLSPTGPALGVFEDAAFTEANLTLADGDVLALFTDGLTESGTDRMQLIGIDGIAGSLTRHASATAPSPERASALVNRLIADAAAYNPSAPRDDVCLFVAVAEPAVTWMDT